MAVKPTAIPLNRWDMKHVGSESVNATVVKA